MLRLPVSARWALSVLMILTLPVARSSAVEAQTSNTSAPGAVPTPRTLPPAGTRPEVVVALPRLFPDVDARVMIVREPERDVVVLDPRSATVEDLAAGLDVLSRVRTRRPAPGSGELIPVTGYVFTAPLPAARRARLAGFLRLLASRPETGVGDLGRGRWLRLPERP